MDIQPITTYTGKVVPLFNDNIDTDQIIPNFNPNKPEFSGATILITGDNFGCGSSREHAAWALKDYGFNIIIAGSFSDIFFMNCTKNGMLPITLGENERKYLASQKEITIDLPNQTVSANDKSFNFQIDETWKHKLVNGLDDIAITLEYEDLIEQYENKNKG